MSSGVAASDVIRSMMRTGFSRDEIYDVLTGVGLPGEQIQLLTDRVSAEFHEAKLESRTSRLGVEVERVFEGAFEELRHELFARMGSVARELEFVKVKLEKLGMQVVELQTLVERWQLSSTSNLSRARGRRVDRGVNRARS
jgi:hypothetical protein